MCGWSSKIDLTRKTVGLIYLQPGRFHATACTIEISELLSEDFSL